MPYRRMSCLWNSFLFVPVTVDIFGNLKLTRDIFQVWDVVQKLSLDGDTF